MRFSENREHQERIAAYRAEGLPLPAQAGTRRDRYRQWTDDVSHWWATDGSPETEPMPSDYAL